MKAIHKLILMSGQELDCWLKTSPTENMNNELALDTTRESLSVKKQTSTLNEQLAERKRNRQFFTSHVHLFIENLDKILSDSRLFLAPVPVQNGLAYTGAGGFRNPVLGVYAQWWRDFHDGSHDSKERPIWHISGSPLSGSHACSSVDEKGEQTDKLTLKGRFWDTWTPFMEINKSCDDAKQHFLGFTLAEVIAILKGEKTTEDVFARYVEQGLCQAEPYATEDCIFEVTYPRAGLTLRGECHVLDAHTVFLKMTYPFEGVTALQHYPLKDDMGIPFGNNDATQGRFSWTLNLLYESCLLVRDVSEQYRKIYADYIACKDKYEQHIATLAFNEEEEQTLYEEAKQAMLQRRYDELLNEHFGENHHPTYDIPPSTLVQILNAIDNNDKNNVEI